MFISNFADLLFDQMIIVEQPFRRGHDAAAAFQLSGASPVSGEQYRCIVIEPRMQRKHRRRPRRYRLGRRQALCVSLKPFNAEQFFTNRGVIVPRRFPAPRSEYVRRASRCAQNRTRSRT
jgi:hypothetical protein